MKLNRTALRTVDILKLVSKKPDGITLDQICEQLSIPKTSAYDILTTLVHTGMVHVAREQKQRYTIGLTAYRVGINYTNNMDFIGTIDPVLKAFSKEVGKTVFFGVRSDDSIVYICKFEPENPIITTATVGTKNPIYCTSLGKAILAYSEEEERLALTERIHFRAFTERHYGKYGAGRAGCLSRPDQFPSPYPAYHSGQDSFHRRTGSGPGKWIRL